DRDLVGLAVTHTDVLDLVTHDDQRREREAAATLDHLRHAVDLDDALLELATLETACSAFSHLTRSLSRSVRLELEPALASLFGELLDAPVVEVTAAVEHDAGNACGLGAFGDQRADL